MEGEKGNWLLLRTNYRLGILLGDIHAVIPRGPISDNFRPTSIHSNESWNLGKI